MAEFLGRRAELRRLIETTRKKSASFIVVKGRRRVGKSRLIREFSREFARYYTFSGLPPDKNTTRESQLEEFSRQIAQQFNTSRAYFTDWADALWAVAERVQSGKILLFFDELSWMGSKDPTFLGKIKDVWDRKLKENDRLIFVVCSSASSWIEENLLGSTGFVGRISYTLTLEELPLADCNRFWPAGISAYEKFKVLAVTGGIPKYLEEIAPHLSAEENIKRLCFTRGGLLVEEFGLIFSDIFRRESAYYRRIVEVLSAGDKELKQIQNVLRLKEVGRIGEYLHELELSGFVARDHTLNLKTGEDSKLSRFRLKDNYLRFYARYIKKNLAKIERGSFDLRSLTALPEWNTIMGLQFENLVLNNRRRLHRLLGLDAADIVNENPYYQRRTARHPGCQIDYLIQMKFGTVYPCEIKFSKEPVASRVIAHMRTRIDALALPRGVSTRPVLVHVNGVTADVADSGYFSAIVDMGALLADGSE